MNIVEPVMIDGSIEIEITVRTSVGESKRITMIGNTVRSYGGSLEEIITYEGAKKTREAWRNIGWRHVMASVPETVERRDLIARATWNQTPFTYHTKEEIAEMRRHHNVWYRRLWRWASARRRTFGRY